MTGSTIDELIQYSQEFPFPVDTTNLLKTWRKAKKPFLIAFGNKTRICRPVKIKLSEEEQDEKFSNFFQLAKYTTCCSEEFLNYLKNNEEGFFTNKVVSSYPEKNIKTGEKLFKSFRKFIKDPVGLKWIQDKASSFMQENTLEGNLYLSVDPLDFLTASENNDNWRTCHSLDGEYRSGNLNLMTDEVTLVAYLASPKQERLKCGITWNSKKWRMFVHVNNNCVYYDRQYPFFSKTLLQETAKFLKNFYAEPVIAQTKQICYKEKTRKINTISFKDSIVPAKEVLDITDYLGYSDLLYSSAYSPIVCLSKKNKNNNIKIKIGKKAPCVCCGKNPIAYNYSLLCKQCIIKHKAYEDYFLTCENCGRRFYPTDEIYWKGNIPYCKNCQEFVGAKA